MQLSLGFILLWSVKSQLTSVDEKCGVSRANGGESDMWSVSRSKLVPIHWLRVTKAYKERIERTPGSSVKLHTVDDPGRSVEPDWGFSMVVHGRPNRPNGHDDVVSSNIILHNAPYCDPDMVNLGLVIYVFSLFSIASYPVLYISSQITLGIEVLERKGPGVFLDCGSNIGSCALSWAAMGHKVYAVEPMSYNVKLIHKSIAENRGRLKGNITVLAMGAGDVDVDTTIYMPTGNAGNNRIGAKEIAVKQNSDGYTWQCEDIQVRRLDKILPRGIHIDVAKFDVQGYEFKAMHGLAGVMDPALGGAGIDVVYFEVEGPMLAENGDSAEKITTLLTDLSYTKRHSDRKDQLWATKNAVTMPS
jgi:FkbM family methyltransferase